jgi:hypothetical protein
MDKGQIGHVRPHLKRFGDFTINVVFAHIRRVLLNGPISYLSLRLTSTKIELKSRMQLQEK